MLKIKRTYIYYYTRASRKLVEMKFGATEVEGKVRVCEKRWHLHGVEGVSECVLS